MRSSWDTQSKTHLEEVEDPVVEVRESELARLKRRAGFALPAFAIAFVALVLVLVGVYRFERVLAPEVARVAAGRSGAIAEELAQLSATVHNHSERDAQHALVTEQQGKDIATVRGTADQALRVARAVRSDLEPVTEQLALVDGQLVALKGTDAQLSETDAQLGQRLASGERAIESLRTETQEKLDTVLRQQSAFGTRIDAAEQQVERFGKRQTLATILSGTLHGVSMIHIVGTKGQ